MHGAAMLTRVLRTVKLDTIDQRSAAGVFMRRAREDLTNQLGGDVSAAQAILIEEAAKTALIVKAVGDYILRQETLVQGESLLPVVMQRESLVANLTRILTTLGLERRARPVESLHDYIAAREGAFGRVAPHPRSFRAGHA